MDESHNVEILQKKIIQMEAIQVDQTGKKVPKDSLMLDMNTDHA